jgi:hypothetical protein
MTACDLLAYFVLLLFITFMSWHHWLIIRRQHQQITELYRLVALKSKDPDVSVHLAREQDLRAARLQSANPPEPEPELVS